MCGWGMVDGLEGANCRHHHFPFLEGVSKRTYTDEQLANIDPPPFEYQGKTYSAYEATQKQRQIERAMRKSKREIVGYEAAGQTEDAQDSAIRLRRLSQEYKAFSKAAGLRTQPERARVDGVGRGEAARAVADVKANEKHIKWLKSIGAENSELNTIAKYRKAKYNNSPAYQLLSGYGRAVKKGDISPLVGFEQYQKTSNALQDRVVGLTTSTDVKIESFSTHFIDRVIGQTSMPHEGMRCGVSIDDVIDTLSRPVKLGKIRTLDDGDIRQTLYGGKCAVTLSIRDKRLIQTNPL